MCRGLPELQDQPGSLNNNNNNNKNDDDKASLSNITSAAAQDALSSASPTSPRALANYDTSGYTFQNKIDLHFKVKVKKLLRICLFWGEVKQEDVTLRKKQ